MVKCDICDMEFSTFRVKVRHSMYFHGWWSSGGCPICSVSIVSVSDDVQHVAESHTDDELSSSLILGALGGRDGVE